MFISLVRNAIFLIIKNSGVREELSYIPFFLQTKLQQITVEENIFDEFALMHLTFGKCISPNATFPFTYHLFGRKFPTLEIWKYYVTQKVHRKP